MVGETIVCEKKGKKPDFKGAGYALWSNKDKNGKEYLTLLDERNGMRVCLWQLMD